MKNTIMSLSSPYKYRSMLFTPAHRSSMCFSKKEYGADIQCLDTEDSVPLESKQLALQNIIKRVLEGEQVNSPTKLAIRINPIKNGEGRGLDDLKFLYNNLGIYHLSELAFIVIPKIYGAKDIYTLERWLEQNKCHDVKLRLIIETLQSINEIKKIISYAYHAVAVGIGWEDLSRCLGLKRPNTNIFLNQIYQQIASQVILRAKEKGLIVMDGVYRLFGSNESNANLKTEAQAAKEMGFNGKSAIHPSQISIINKVFSPNTDELTWAQFIVDNLPSGWVKNTDPFKLLLPNGDYEMIENQVVFQALQILEGQKAIYSTNLL